MSALNSGNLYKQEALMGGNIKLSVLGVVEARRGKLWPLSDKTSGYSGLLALFPFYCALAHAQQCRITSAPKDVFSRSSCVNQLTVGH